MQGSMFGEKKSSRKALLLLQLQLCLSAHLNKWLVHLGSELGIGIGFQAESGCCG
jgi:hypothetical protein